MFKSVGQYTLLFEDVHALKGERNKWFKAKFNVAVVEAWAHLFDGLQSSYEVVQFVSTELKVDRLLIAFQGPIRVGELRQANVANRLVYFGKFVTACRELSNLDGIDWLVIFSTNG